MKKPCLRAPAGWKCTREGGHEGPCAAIDIPSVAERAYVDDHAAVICPTCSGLLARTEAPVANQSRQPVSCRNPKCPEVGKVKSFARRFVELEYVDGA